MRSCQDVEKMRRKQRRWNTFKRFSCAAGLATIEERADDAGSVYSHFGGSSELLVFPNMVRKLWYVGCSMPNPLSYFGVKRGDASDSITKVDEAVDRFQCIVLDD